MNSNELNTLYPSMASRLLNIFSNSNRRQPELSRDDAMHLDAALLSEACYVDNPRQWIDLKGILGDKFQHNITSMDKTVDDEGFSYILARDETKGNVVYVAIRGTDNVDNWMSNFAAFDWGILNSGFFACMSGKVHTGFYDLAKKIPISMLLEELSMGNTVVFTGHSMGGAVAALGASRLLLQANKKLRDQIKCITFGAPLYCDDVFAKHLEDRLGREFVMRAFQHYIHLEDKVPLILINLSDYADKLLPTAFTPMVPQYHPSGAFKFLPARNDNDDEISAEDHVKNGMDVPEPDIRTITEMATTSLRAHVVQWYSDSIYSKMEAYKRNDGTREGDVKPFLGDKEVDVEKMMCSFESYQLQNDMEGRVEIHRLFLQGPNVWATRKVKRQDITISSLHGGGIFEVRDVKEICRERNQVEYRLTCVVQGALHTEIQCKVDWSSIFVTTGNTNNKTCASSRSYYIPASRRLAIMGIHDILVYIRSLKHAFGNRESVNDVSDFGRRANEQLKELDGWLYTMLQKLDQNERKVLERALHDLKNGTVAENFVMEVLGTLEKKANHNGSFATDSVTTSEISDFVNGGIDDNRAVSSFEMSSRLELLLCVVLYHVFWKRVAVSWVLYIKAVKEKYGWLSVTLRYFMAVLSLGAVHLFSWTTFDRELRGSSYLHQELLVLFRREDNIEDYLALEKYIIYKCQTNVPWSELVAPGSNFEGVMRSQDSIKKFMSFLGPTFRLRELALDSKMFHIALVGQSGAGKTSLYTSGFFPQISATFRRETTRAAMYSLTNEFKVTDYPGMLGNDGAILKDAHLDVLKQTLESIDFVIIFVKINQRDVDLSQMFEAIRGKRTYVCLTHVDTETENRFLDGEDLEEIKNAHSEYERHLGRYFGLQDVHCFLSSHGETRKRNLINRLSVSDTEQMASAVSRDHATRVVDEIFSHGFSSLRQTIEEAARSEDIREEEIEKLFRGQ